MNACGHDGAGCNADLGDGRTRQICHRCAGTLKRIHPSLLSVDERGRYSTDCPPCPKCGLPSTRYCAEGIVTGELMCVGCGWPWFGNAEQMDQANYADACQSLLDVDNDEDVFEVAYPDKGYTPREDKP